MSAVTLQAKIISLQPRQEMPFARFSLQGFDQLDWIQYSGDRFLFARAHPVSVTNISCHNRNWDADDDTITCNFYENVTCDGGASAYRYYTAISCK